MSLILQAQKLDALKASICYIDLVIQKGRSVGMKVSFHIEEGVLPFWLSPYGDIFLIHLKMSSAYFI